MLYALACLYCAFLFSTRISWITLLKVTGEFLLFKKHLQPLMKTFTLNGVEVFHQGKNFGAIHCVSGHWTLVISH